MTEQVDDVPAASPGQPIDRLGRRLRDLRVSVTDRCNFRCRYCMPRERFGRDHAFLPKSQLLTFEEIERVARIAAAAGVHKLRLTGGEPLLRRDLDALVARLAAVPGIDDLALTTNASLLTPAWARALRSAGLQRINVSLDALEPTAFQAMTDAQYSARQVLGGIAAAADAGLAPVKVNMEVKRGVNDDQILPMAEYFRRSGHVLRFIEYMDVGNSNHWRRGEVLPGEAVVQAVHGRWPLEALPGNYPGEVANRWRYVDGAGEIGVIASVTQPFCGGCSRLRMSAEGRLFTCLFGSRGFDLRGLLRSGADDDAIGGALHGLWQRRDDRYSELRGRAAVREEGQAQRVEMSYIGG
ncbi:MAG: GTP 3',8-cyclase MoaA [Salinisphaera sp.]|nr:GTP 3',8-cyclase MoaA [Salinisphaera sp.]